MILHILGNMNYNEYQHNVCLLRKYKYILKGNSNLLKHNYSQSYFYLIFTTSIWGQQKETVITI